MGQPMRDSAGNIWEQDAQGEYTVFVSGPPPQAAPRVLVGPDPVKARREERAEQAADRSASASERAAEAANRQAGAAERTASNQDYGNAFQLRSAYDALPPVKEYRVSIGQLATGIKTAPNASGDNALIYAYAKAMDPGSVVRESEMGMAASGQSVFDSAAANLKKQFGIAGGGQLSPQVRDRLRREMLNKVTEQNRIYNAQRQRFIKDAQTFGFDPKRIVGDHDGDAYRPDLKRYTDAQRQSLEEVAGEEAPEVVGGSVGSPNQKPDGSYKDSALGQGLSGINEGIASVLGAPVDLTTAAVNLVPRALNGLANTNLPTITNPTLGSDWLKRQMTGLGAINAPAAGMEGVRRIGQSLGAAAIPAGFAGSAAKAGGQMLAGLGGGLGSAGAQQAFPGNVYAEMAGELAGGGLTGAGLLGAAKRNATRQIEAAVPTIPQLKEQAGDLYRAAEARGVAANPEQTQSLADTLRAAMGNEGLVSPTGRINEVYPKAREGLQLVDDYAGQPMTPTQMQTVRKVVADGLSSPDRTDRRLSGILTDAVDEWVAPFAPELSEARDVASRYLTAEQLEQARELAGARAGQFTGSGFENALRTEYRGLDRGAIKGSKRFSDDVTGAIETVSRGTPLSNAARGFGRLAPTGPVAGLGSVVPGLGMASVVSPGAGALTAGTLAGLGVAGRGLATHLGIKAADQAELVARNGGNLPTVPTITPDAMQAISAWLAAQEAKYLPSQDNRGPVYQQR